MIENTPSFQAATCAEFLQSTCQNRVLKSYLPWELWISYNSGPSYAAGFFISRGLVHDINDNQTVYDSGLNGILSGFTPTGWHLRLHAQLCVDRHTYILGTTDPIPDWVYTDPSVGKFDLDENVNGVWIRDVPPATGNGG